MQRLASALCLLFAFAACKSAPQPMAPGAPVLPEPPVVRYDTAPTAPTPPRAPEIPTYSLPKPTDIAWQSVWSEDFATDGHPAPLPKDLGPVAVVMPPAATDASRLGVVTSLLAASMATADHGTFDYAKLSAKETTAGVDLLIDLIDPIGRWVHSAACKDPAVKSVFVVRVYDHAATGRDVVKFDIAPHLKGLADYNEKAVAYNGKRVAYLAARAAHEKRHAEYLARHAEWRDAMTMRVVETQAAHAKAVDEAVRAFNQQWVEYALACDKQKLPSATKPATPTAKSVEAPRIEEPTDLAPATPTEEAHLLSLDDMRKLLLQTATETVPSTRLRLGGQFVDAATGLTTATVDATLTLPAAAQKTEAGMLRELLQRLTR
ncbi:MAG: hypothetical protein NT107_11725 [Planctomycetota bacterium]|nr:hypothetical protein [Planctomycetota bacterium]